MLIGIDASRANEAQKTGVGWYAHSLICQLKKFSIFNFQFLIDEPVNFVLYTREPLKGELGELPENLSVKVLKWWPGRLWTQLRLSWEMLWHAPDVLFIPAHVFPIIHPKKTVMTIHDVAALKFLKSYNWFERWYSVWSAKYAVKKLWKVIVPSDSVKQDLIFNFSRQSTGSRISSGQFSIFNCCVVKHGYDERYKMRDGGDKEIDRDMEIVKKYNIKKPYLLSIGRLEEKKNTVRIIQAFEKIRLQDTGCRLQLVLIGKPGYGYENVKEVIQNSAYKSDIITPGWVSDEDLPTLMRGASVFVFPSLAEGFGIPILEAMASGVPVVASKGGALEEIGGEACVYVDPMKVEDIAEKIVEITQNSNNRTQMIERGLQRVKEFGWEKCAEETAKVLGIGC